MRTILTTVFGAVLLASCSSAESVDYTVANGYFVRNDAPKDIPAIISTRPEFESVFGMATVMGPDGRPTAIDFSKQCVVPVILPPTQHPTELIVEKVSKSDGAITVSCSALKDAQAATFIMQPCAVVVIDRPSPQTSVSVDMKETVR